MAVPFMLGNFSQGLFGGAQSAASLYTAYQGIFAQQEAADEITKAKEEDKRNKNIEDTVQGLRTQLGTPGLNQDADKAIQAQNQPAAPASPPASSTDKGPVAPKPTQAGPTGAANASPDATGRGGSGTSQSAADALLASSSDAYRPTGVGLPQQPVAPSYYNRTPEQMWQSQLNPQVSPVVPEIPP
jgi:hypothetical protein